MQRIYGAADFASRATLIVFGRFPTLALTRSGSKGCQVTDSQPKPPLAVHVNLILLPEGFRVKRIPFRSGTARTHSAS